MKQVYYFDHHSTTPCHPAVVEQMLPWFGAKFGNPSSITSAHGREAASALENARHSVARLLGVESGEVYFTSGATESNNIALSLPRPGSHVISSAIEHKSVLGPLARLEQSGVLVTRIAPDREGVLSHSRILDAIRPETVLVSIQVANGEVGSIQPIAQIAAGCRERGILFHTDATQAAGRIPLDLSQTDLVSISAHKFYGPKGIGALVVRQHAQLTDPPIIGGGQERGVRAGTVNMPGVIGLAAALELSLRDMRQESARLSILRDRLQEGITNRLAGVFVHGPDELRLAGNLNVSFERVEAEALMMALGKFSLSSGSACSSGDRAPSPVLLSMGVSETLARGSLRIGLGRENDEEQIDILVRDLESAVARLREISHG